jgi:16S rRNA (cytidine1402-2'-O)-methyltransferase
VDAAYVALAAGRAPPVAAARAARNAAALEAPPGPVDSELQALLLQCTLKAQRAFRRRLGELAARYAELSPRGECTLVVEGGGEVRPDVDVEAELARLLASGLGPRDAAARLVVATGKPRRQLYQLALSLARSRP